MNETDKRGGTSRQTPVPDASETTDAESTQETRRQKALQELFLILEEDAEKEGKPANAVIRAVPMLITTSNEAALYILRINPAIVSNEKLNVAVLDLYNGETNHLQQWVIKAEWTDTDKEPKITGWDDSMVKEGAKQFRLTEIAEYAVKMLRGRAAKTDAVNTVPSLTMRMPPEYSNGIN